MAATTRADTPVAIESDGVEVRKREIGGDMTVAFVHLPQMPSPRGQSPRMVPANVPRSAERDVACIDGSWPGRIK